MSLFLYFMNGPFSMSLYKTALITATGTSWCLHNLCTVLSCIPKIPQTRGSFVTVNEIFRFDFCLTVHHQLGKVIQMNQLDATMIY